ncbi:MAG: beta-galactosidase trimerization domain-containing protein [Bacteroidota bacterium]
MKNFIFYFLTILFLAGCQLQSNQNDQKNEQSVYEIQARNGKDPFLDSLYMEMNNSPMQQKLRSSKPFPVGMVYYQQRGDNLDSAKKEFQVIRDLGFTALKQVELKAPGNPVNFEQEVFHAAIDAGISPWYYGKAGWRTITQDLIDSLGISYELIDNNLEKIQNHPRMIDYQKHYLHQRVKKMHLKPKKPKGMGEPGRNSPYIPERLVPEFSKWLRNQYKTLDQLKLAWNTGFTGNLEISNFDQAAALLKSTHEDEYGNRWGRRTWDFRRMRDAMRFQADLIIDNYQQTMEMFYEWDPEEPERTGGHQLFENQAINSWDLEAQAKSASIGGSFYSSIHLTHHFFLVDGEITLPVYMQSRLVADMFKGGWSATWESTGGPTQWSGHHNLTVDGKLMQQLFLSYIAAGLKGIGIWMWNSRGEGWETGEYALCDIQGQPTDRARVAGNLSEILQKQRFELWDAKDEPMVGVFYSWENEAMLGALSLGAYQLSTPVFESNRDRKFRQYHSEARIGISRALINHNIPFEYVTDRDIQSGLAARYPVIYLPYMLAVDELTMKGLKQYVEEGGKIVADFPLMMLDNYGRLNKQLPGSDFETLFGFMTADYFHTFNESKSYKNKNLDSQFGEIKLTDAKVEDTFDDGTPAIITNNFGEGKTLVFNFEASRNAFRPGNTWMEEILAKQSIDGIRPPYTVKNNNNSVVFRRSAPEADHYLIINKGAEETLAISSEDIDFVGAEDLIKKENLSIKNNTFEVTVPAKSGSWIRASKR